MGMKMEDWSDTYKVGPGTRNEWIEELLAKDAAGEISHSSYIMGGDSVVFLFRGVESTEVFDCLVRRHGENFIGECVDNRALLEEAQRLLQRLADDDEAVLNKAAHHLVKKIGKALDTPAAKEET
jgi:hypothetical protein